MNAQTLFAIHVAENLPADLKWNIVKEHRSRMLAECDWTQIPDAALTLEEKAAWSDYRQALRDIPQAFDTPDEVVFPDPPGGG